jgi:DNA-binding MarR family transcriptional regulator
MSAADPTSELSAAGHLLVLLHRAHDGVETALEAEMRERTGIGCSHFDVLRTLMEAPDEQLRMVDIAERMCISRSGVTQSVDRLEELGLVSRVTQREDRRLVLAAITPAGRTLVPIGQEAIEAVAARLITQQLTERQAASLATALAKLAHNPRDRAPGRPALRD